MSGVRLAIDALAMDGKKVGIEKYVYNLITTLSTFALDMEIDIHIQEHMRENFESKGNINCKFHRDFKGDRERLMYELFNMPHLYRKEKYDIVHFMDCLSPLVPIGAKRVYTLYDLAYLRNRRPFTLKKGITKGILFDIATRSADGILCASQSLKEDLIQQYKFLDEDKVYVTYLAAEQIKDVPVRGAEADWILQQYGIDDRFILYVGPIDSSKNIAVLLKAYGEIKANTSLPHRLVLCGEMGEPYDHITEVIGEYGALKEDIVYIHNISDEILPLLYSRADVFVYPSLYERFDIYPMEAMLYETPIISSNIPYLSEVIGDAGLYFHPYDHVELGLLLVGILSDEALRGELKNRGKQQVAKFSWGDTAKKTLSAYRNIAQA